MPKCIFANLANRALRLQRCSQLRTFFPPGQLPCCKSCE
ncbi:hypothetical protein [Azospirillum argentinense]